MQLQQYFFWYEIDYMWCSARINIGSITVFIIHKWYSISIRYFILYFICWWHYIVLQFEKFTRIIRCCQQWTMSKMIEWLNANRLSLNIDKTNFMISRSKGNKESCPTIHKNGSSIQEVDDAKFLGIIIDNKLNWIEHIKCISRKIAKGTGIIIKARKSFESETLLNLYNALISPHLTYGIHVWGTAAAVHWHRLHLFQKKKCSYHLWSSPKNSHRSAL